MKNIILIFLIVSFAIRSSAQIKVHQIKIDPESDRGNNACAIFSEIRYIPLETNKNSLFGAIDQLYIDDNFFVILDKQTKYIYIFSRAGQFHAKIYTGNKYGNGIKHFTVDKKLKIIQFFKGEDGGIIKMSYDFDGKQTSKVFFKYPFTDLFLQYEIFPNDGFVGERYTVSNSFADSTAFEITSILSSRTLNKYFPYNMKTAPISAEDRSIYTSFPFFRTDEDTVFLYTRPYDYSIYRISPFQVQKDYQFILPKEYSLPNDFERDTLLRAKRNSFLDENPLIVFQVPLFFLLHNNNILFKLENKDAADKLNKKLLLYNLKSGNLTDLFRVIPDSLSYFLPIVDYQGMIREYSIAFTDGQCIYTSISSLTLFQIASMNKDKNVKLPNELNKYLNKGSRKDNPVIVELLPK